MLRDIREKKITCVVAYKIDRLTRSVRDFYALMDLFDQHGVKFVSVTQSFDTQSPMGRLLRNILLDFAQFEREMTADRTRDKMHQRAEKGLWNGGIVPYGYASENKRLVPHPEEAERLRFMFEHFARHASLSKLRDELNRRGWSTRTGGPWGKAALQFVLRNRLYLGFIQLKGKSYQGVHEALVEAPLFEKAGLLAPDRTHEKTAIPRAYPLKGLLHCSDCGSVMTPHYVQKRRRDGSVNRIAYYRCTKTMHFNNRVCRIKHVNAAEIEATVVRELGMLSRNDAYVRMTVEAVNGERDRKVEPLEKEEARVVKRQAEIEAEIQRFVTAIGQGRLSVGRLEKEIQDREENRRALEAELDAVRRRLAEETATGLNAELLLRGLRDFEATFSSLDPQEQAEALQCVLKGVTVTPDKLLVEVFELAEFAPAGGSQDRTRWLPGLDSNSGRLSP
jgi:site-specific DNA recombinase